MTPTIATPRFLICRLGHVGDVILTLPVAGALRERFPNAFIGWVTEKKSSAMLRGHRAIDAVIELDSHWFQSLKTINETKRTLREHDFGISIDCQGSAKSALVSWLSGAPRRIGYGGRRSNRVSRIVTNDPVVPVFSHQTDRSLELLSPLDIHAPRIRWDLPISQAARLWARRWRRTIAARKLAIINPGGTWPSKLWEADRFAATARYIRDRYGYRTAVIWGNYEERLMAEEIVSLSDASAVLAPDTDLHHLAAMIETADLFLSGDTGPLHMAVAVNTLAIGLYGATRPTDSGPYGHIALQQAYESGSLRRRRRADNLAMRAIGVDHVCKVIDELESNSSLMLKAA